MLVGTVITGAKLESRLIHLLIRLNWFGLVVVGAGGMTTITEFPGNFFGLSCCNEAATGSQGLFSKGNKLSTPKTPRRAADGPDIILSTKLGNLAFNV